MKNLVLLLALVVPTVATAAERTLIPFRSLSLAQHTYANEKGAFSITYNKGAFSGIERVSLRADDRIDFGKERLAPVQTSLEVVPMMVRDFRLKPGVKEATLRILVKNDSAPGVSWADVAVKRGR